VCPSSNLKTETDPVSGTLCFLVFIIPDDGQSPETESEWLRMLASSSVSKCAEQGLSRVMTSFWEKGGPTVRRSEGSRLQGETDKCVRLGAKRSGKLGTRRGQLVYVVSSKRTRENGLGRL
jgi:hypothetical protein